MSRPAEPAEASEAAEAAAEPADEAPDEAADEAAGAADTGQEAVDSLVRLLDLEAIEVDIFRGVSPQVEQQRVFGGQVAGQALVAAGRTVPSDRPVHSLHAYFIRPGDPSVPIVYQVDRIRDGVSFTTRRVVAVQHGKAIFNLAASFHRVESGLEHQGTMPAVPDPEGLPTLAERHGQGDSAVDRLRRTSMPIDLRYIDEPPWLARGGPRREPHSQVWMRAAGVLPDEQLVHVCVLTYASDMTLLDSVLVHHGLAWGTEGLRGASLDHAMWFHRPFRADEWLLYESESPSASGALGLATGRIWSRDGRYVASVVQEGLLRVISRRAD